MYNCLLEPFLYCRKDQWRENLAHKNRVPNQSLQNLGNVTFGGLIEYICFQNVNIYMNVKTFSIKPPSMFPKSVSAKNLNLYLEGKGFTVRQRGVISLISSLFSLFK